MESICEELKEDMHKIEEDSKKIDCYAILDLILHSFKCFMDTIKCCFKIKYHNIIYIIMKWIDGLKDFNSTNKNWIVPRKGTKAYIKVMQMIKPQIVNTNKFKPMMTTKVTI